MKSHVTVTLDFESNDNDGQGKDLKQALRASLVSVSVTGSAQNSMPSSKNKASKAFMNSTEGKGTEEDYNENDTNSQNDCYLKLIMDSR
mmetsp:Transcript_3372/g.4879  ORF Transcript_3372/g.4879 Transcript_3372/m.4879 type:complete len:89 (-) Transcript_3372:34-300(-)